MTRDYNWLDYEKTKARINLYLAGRWEAYRVLLVMGDRQVISTRANRLQPAKPLRVTICQRPRLHLLPQLSTAGGPDD